MQIEAKIRCAWVGTNKPYYEVYHDTEWGVPVHEDRKHFEMLILEGAQAGLNWKTILKRRIGYQKAFKEFDVQKVASMTDPEIELLLQDASIIRNRLKIFSVRKSAQIFLKIQQEFGSFNTYIWQFVGGKPRINRPKSLQDIPARTSKSDALSKDLKKRGMSFVGSTIMYAHMQATGIINDHTIDCFKSTLG